MNRIILSLSVLMYVSTVSISKAQTSKRDRHDFFDTAVNNHNQIFPYSGIPSAIEMVLKGHKVVDLDFYELQNAWQNKTDGSFRDFDKKQLYGITFIQKFAIPRDANFPIDSLFQTIEDELKSDRKVIISLQGNMGWSIFVVCKQTPNGEFVSYCKDQSHTLIVRNTKEIVRKSNGTEIMVYREHAK